MAALNAAYISSRASTSLHGASTQKTIAHGTGRTSKKSSKEREGSDVLLTPSTAYQAPLPRVDFQAVLTFLKNPSRDFMSRQSAWSSRQMKE